MSWEIDSILEQSISQIASGKARVESCLLTYPMLADELEPLLVTAETLRTIPKPSLGAAAKARIEEQLLVAAAANPRLSPPVKRRLPVVLPRWRWAFNAFTAAVVLVFLLMTTMVTASADALPGSTLYPVKLAAEDAWLWVAPARSEPALHLRFAQRRLDEAKELAKQGEFDRSVLESMMAHLDAALNGLEDLPPAIALPLLAEVSAFIGEAQASLSSLMDILPAAARSFIVMVLDEGQTKAGRARALGRRMRSDEPAAPEDILDSVGPLSITDTPTPTQTVDPFLTPTMTPTTEPTATLPATPTSTPEPPETPLPEPTDEPPSDPSDRPTATSAPESTDPPPEPTKPPPPEPTQPPPEPTKTKDVPPGHTKTPEPPGQTRTPKPPKPSNNESKKP